MANKNGFACSGRGGNDVHIRFYSSLPQRRMARLQQSLRQQSSASDSILRSSKGEWPACSSRRGSDLPHPILIFVAAKKNGSACNGRGGYEVRVRFHSSLPRRRTVSPADRHYPTDASILDFEARLGNHCRFLPGNALQCAVILDLSGSIWESLQVFAWKRPPVCSDS